LSGELKPFAELLSGLEYGPQQLTIPFVELTRRGAVAGAKGPRTLQGTIEVSGYLQGEQAAKAEPEPPEGEGEAPAGSLEGEGAAGAPAAEAPPGLPRGAPPESAASAAPAPAPEPREKGKRGRGDKAVAQQTPAMLVAAITEKELFDPSRQPPSVEDTTAASVPVTQPPDNVTVVGVRIFGKDREAFVTDGTQGQAVTRRVRLGDQIAGYTVKGIERTALTLTSPSGDIVSMPLTLDKGGAQPGSQRPPIPGRPPMPGRPQ